MFKDSQRNYNYLENIYQWEATCGSDANDTEASYHPYDDDYEAGTSEYRDAVYCTTHVLEESDQMGTLLYNIDEENGITRERLYDTDGMRKADIRISFFTTMIQICR